MSHETFALINDKDQVVNHIVIDKDDANFEENMAGQLEHWGCVRYVETNIETDVIVLDESPTIWTTHTETDGFVLPPEALAPPVVDIAVAPALEIIEVKKSELPSDSKLLEENAHLRPEDWVFPSEVRVIEG
jgi:hypothetical protein